MPIVFRSKSWGLARPITHPAEIGAPSIARAAADHGIVGGSYIGPAAGRSSPDTPCSSGPASAPATPNSSDACGTVRAPYWRNNPLSPATV